MKPNPGPGRLIVLEGLDGAGTTTQSALLADWLRRYRGLRVHVTREPSPGPAGAQIRSVLSRRLWMDGKTLAALFAADRLDHLYGQGGVVERLQAGEWVIMDRYFHSSFAYQSLVLTPEELRWLWYLHDPCPIPDVTFLLDVPVETCLMRIALNRGFHFELFEKADTLEKVRSQYLDTIQRLRRTLHNIQVIDGTRPAKSITRITGKRIEEMFLKNALTIEEQQKLWRQWPGLATIRRKAEEKLSLALVLVKRLPDTSGREEGGSKGGYQLEFANDDRMYHVAGYFTNEYREMRIRPMGQIDDDTFENLKEICPLLIPAVASSQQELLPGG